MQPDTANVSSQGPVVESKVESVFESGAALDRDDLPSNTSEAQSVEAVISRRLSRRGLIRGALATSFTAAVLDRRLGLAQPADEQVGTLTFKEIDNTITPTHRVAEGYTALPLIRWGDPILAGAPEFAPEGLNAGDQAGQFGYNCDFIAYMPLPRGSTSSDHGLLCVNHEYTNPPLMWAGVRSGKDLSREQCEVEMAAHGHSVVEIRKTNGKWSHVAGGAYNRRITVHTPMRLSGPVAGHPRVRTQGDPTGLRVLGTVNNCAGGFTPWGTVLFAEENFNLYFSGSLKALSPREQANAKRYGMDSVAWHWGRFHPRFHMEREPNELNRFGWMVEYDPYNPDCIPQKRTALGRFRHEGATCAVNRDGRLVVYSGDDQQFEYVYKYVSHGSYHPTNRHANDSLLDDGTLFVARFDDDGTCTWLPLTWGHGPLTHKNGFESQADVLIEARRAADLLGATPMDRPEDVEPNPATGRVYVMLTNNTKRKPANVDKANPRPANRYGHILELLPPGAEKPDAVPEQVDHASTTFTWNVFLRGGNPFEPSHNALYHPAVSRNGWVACPDNCAFDQKGRIWIATDQGGEQKEHGIADGLRACDTLGPGRALTKLFFAAPQGAELCGPCFTPDGTTLFVSVQHPGEDSTLDKPSTRWPDPNPDSKMPPRPSVVAITRDDGGPIGG